MAKQLHLVFGGELVDPSSVRSCDVRSLDIVGKFPNYAEAHQAWRAASQRTMDDAHTRYFIANLHRLRVEGRAESAAPGHED